MEIIICTEKTTMRSFCKAIICKEKASVERNDVDIHLYLRMSDYDVQRTKDEGMKRSLSYR